MKFLSFLAAAVALSFNSFGQQNPSTTTSGQAATMQNSATGLGQQPAGQPTPVVNAPVSNAPSATPPTGTTEDSRVPIIVELFVSGGCPTCGEAESLVRDLAQGQSVNGVRIIALPQQVDYWNNLGDRHDYTSPQFSERQTSYVMRFGHDKESISPPMVVVDGLQMAAGTSREDILKAIDMASKQEHLPVGIELQGGNILVGVPPVHTASPSALYLAVVESGAPALATNSARQDNGGGAANANLVRTITKLADLPAGPGQTLTLPMPAPVTAGQTIVVFAQEYGTGRIFGTREWTPTAEQLAMSGAPSGKATGSSVKKSSKKLKSTKTKTKSKSAKKG